MLEALIKLVWYAGQLSNALENQNYYFDFSHQAIKMVLIRHSDNQTVIICDSHHKQCKMQTKNTSYDQFSYSNYTWYHYYLLSD